MKIKTEDSHCFNCGAAFVPTRNLLPSITGEFIITCPDCGGRYTIGRADLSAMQDEQLRRIRRRVEDMVRKADPSFAVALAEQFGLRID
jgi:DNA-directed RNA polymerase subunit RPC12/RpoP